MNCPYSLRYSFVPHLSGNRYNFILTLAMPAAGYAYAFLIAPLPQVWQFPSLIAFWISVALTLISGGIYLLPQKTE